MKTLFIILLSAILFSSCDNIQGSGKIKTEKRNVEQFDGVQVSGSVDVEITSGNNESVQVEADDNVLKYIVTKVNDGLLEIYFEPGKFFTEVHAKVFVSAPVYKKLYVRGYGNIVSANGIKNTGLLSVKISGSGKIDAEINAPGVSADISGSGDVNLRGRCRNFNASISGSGELHCSKLLSENTTVNISGSGTAHVFASVSLNATTSGSGDIYYQGNPAAKQVNKSGSGEIQEE